MLLRLVEGKSLEISMLDEIDGRRLTVRADRPDAAIAPVPRRFCQHPFSPMPRSISVRPHLQACWAVDLIVGEQLVFAKATDSTQQLCTDLPFTPYPGLQIHSQRNVC